jgi:hypothetical protein
MAAYSSEPARSLVRVQVKAVAEADGPSRTVSGHTLNREGFSRSEFCRSVFLQNLDNESSLDLDRYIAS